MRGEKLMKRKILIAGVSAIWLTLPALSHALEAKIQGYLQNILFFQTDSDFDPSTPYYLPSGQDVGYITTYLNNKVSLIEGDLLIYYEAELGMNIWSRNTPEDYTFSSQALLYKHRQIYAQVTPSPRWHLRAGYQYIQDPTGLFINHWLGAIAVGFHLERVNIEAFAGQIPDQTYEGWDLSRNNFRHDVFAGGIWAEWKKASLTLKGGLIGLYNTEVIRRAMWLIAPAVSLSWKKDLLEIGCDFMLQGGLTNRGALDGSDEKTFAGALQVYAWWGAARTAWGEYRDGRVVPGLVKADEKNIWGWGVSLLYLSPDNSRERDSWNYAFLYSGRSLSRTLFLTEDELRDRGDNIDQRVSQQMGTFYRTRAGYLLLDVSGYRYLMQKLLLMQVAGVAIALEDANALGNYFIAGEIDVALRYEISDHLVLDVVNAVIIPGKAGSAFINYIDRTKTRPVYSLEISLNAFF